MINTCNGRSTSNKCIIKPLVAGSTTRSTDNAHIQPPNMIIAWCIPACTHGNDAPILDKLSQGNIITHQCLPHEAHPPYADSVVAIGR